MRWFLSCPMCLADFDACLMFISSFFQRALCLSLPEDVWRIVLSFTDPLEYTSLSRKSCGVNREFYTLLKNSLVLIRLHSPVSPLLGMVWMHSRELECSDVKCIEGASTLLCWSTCECLMCVSASALKVFLYPSGSYLSHQDRRIVRPHGELPLLPIQHSSYFALSLPFHASQQEQRRGAL